MKRTGVAASSRTPPLRRSDITPPSSSPQQSAARSGSDSTKRATPVTPTKQSPTKRSPISPLRSPPTTLSRHSSHSTASTRQHRSSHHSSTVIPQSQRTIYRRTDKPVTPLPRTNVQVWSFDEKDNSDERQQLESEGSKEQEVRIIPLSALFDWSSTGSSVLSFQSLSAYTLPPIPSYDTIPTLCGKLMHCGSSATADVSYDAVCGLREFGAADLLSSPHASLIVSSLVFAVLMRSSALLAVSSASLLLLADVFDAAHSSHIAAELYLLLVQHILDNWHSTTHWPKAHDRLWLEDESQPAYHNAQSHSGKDGSAPTHVRRSHAHLIRVLRFITIIQRQLPAQWVYFSPFTHHSIVDATLQLYATTLSPASTSLLSPAHMLAIIDPSCPWLSLWLYQLPTRKLFIRLLTSPAYTPLLDWMAASRPAALADQSSCWPTAGAAASDETVPLFVPDQVVPLLIAVQRARLVECFLQHDCGKALLRSAWARAGLTAREVHDVRDDVQRLHAAARYSFTQAESSE